MFRIKWEKCILAVNSGTTKYRNMNLENQSSKSEELKTKDLERQVENLKKIIELQNKTVEHDRKQQKIFKYEMM